MGHQIDNVGLPGAGVAVGAGVGVGAGLAEGSGVAVGAGVTVGIGLVLGAGVAVGTGLTLGEGLGVAVPPTVIVAALSFQLRFLAQPAVNTPTFTIKLPMAVGVQLVDTVTGLPAVVV